MWMVNEAMGSMVKYLNAGNVQLVSGAVLHLTVCGAYWGRICLNMMFTAHLLITIMLASC